MTGELVEHKPNRPPQAGWRFTRDAPSREPDSDPQGQKGRRIPGVGDESSLPGGFAETKKPRKRNPKG